MTRMIPTLLLASICAGCPPDDGHSCTLELRTAVEVTVLADEGVEIDEVTVENTSIQPCDGGSVRPEADAGASFAYACFEQAPGGTYVIRVHAGERVETREVEVSGDGRCHVDYPAVEVTIDLR